MRTAVVGGGSAGIGFATAEHLARTGLRVLITGRDEERLALAVSRLAERTGGQVEGVVHDVTDPGSTRALAERVADDLAVLVLNAGGPRPGRITDLAEDDWYQAAELLLHGPLRLANACLPGLAERGYGRVVFVTSTAVRQPQPDLAASVVLRASVTAAAKLLAREYAPHGVTVNCVAPGATATGRREQVLRARAEREGGSYEDLAARDAADIPAGRAGTPEEIGAAVAFLASEAAGYVTGTVLTVDGGRTETI